MCGIAGFIHFTDNRQLAEEANRIQQHRGPDSQAVWADNYIALAHQRLSIIDLSEKAAQPFQKDQLVIVFNGEIYNYQELRQNLIKQHHISFRSQSDTEVVLEMFRVYREKCLQYFIGMFAFTIYNTSTQQLFLARDHFGIKPLFFVQQNQKFAFASELKTLSRLKEIAQSLNTTQLLASVNYVWVPGNTSILAPVQKLPPAHFLWHTPQAVSAPQRYWQLPEKQDTNIDEATATAQLSDAIEASVKRHLVADVPISSFLSGGLDSSLISKIAQDNTTYRLSTYTIAFSEDDKRIEQMPDDQKYASVMAAKYNFAHNELLIRPKIVELLPKMTYHLDEPIGDPAAINLFLMSQNANQNGVKVLLSGMGADEIFFGYRRHKALMLSEMAKKWPAPLRKTIHAAIQPLPVKIGQRGLRLIRWAKRFMDFANLPTEEAYQRSYSYYDQNGLQQLFNSGISEQFNAVRRQHQAVFNQYYSNDLINQICQTDIHMFMQGLNLTYTDRASMAASVEVRVPFIDREVVELAMQLPGHLKFNHRILKYILRKAAEKYLPHEIIYRPKASFGVPLRSWISGDLNEMVGDLLSEQQIKKRGIFNPAFISKLIENDRKGRQDNAYQIYQLLTIELWLQQFSDG